MTIQSFISLIVPYVKKYAPSYGVKVISPILGQAVLESQYGNSELAMNAHNYFGLKYNDKQPDRCPSATNKYYKTGSEQNADGSYSSSVMAWQLFPTTEAGIKGYFDFLFSKYAYNRYENLKGVTDPKVYLENIKADGYATSISYVQKVMNVISKYNLTKYDIAEEQTKKFYRCQLGAFKNVIYAENLKKRIVDAGFNAIVKQYGDLYKVQVAACAYKENAEKILKQLENKGFSAIIVYC